MKLLIVLLFLALCPPNSFGFNAKTLKNWGLVNDEGDSSVQAPKAWTLEEGNEKVLVAVIDTGIDPSTKELSSNLWHDPEHGTYYGWDFVHDAPNPFDVNGHGTHISGIIDANLNPSKGVSGVAHHITLMEVAYYSESNSGAVNLKNTVKAINYAVLHGAKIINYSGGGPDFSEDEYVAIRNAEEKGVLFVAAAGNEHQNTDLIQNYFYPAAYRLSNIISVAATDIHNNLLASSNWGKSKVDVAAPGENIFSTLPVGKYGYMSGTSQATAFVTGIAALLLSQNPNLTPVQLKQVIIQSVDTISGLETKIASGGRVNAYKALLLGQKKKLEKN